MTTAQLELNEELFSTLAEISQDVDFKDQAQKDLNKLLKSEPAAYKKALN